MWGAGAGLPHAAVVLHERECVWCRQIASVMCGQKASSALFRHGSVRVALSGQLCAGSSVGGVAASRSGRSPGHPAVARLLSGAPGCLGVVPAYRLSMWPWQNSCALPVSWLAPLTRRRHLHAGPSPEGAAGAPAECCRHCRDPEAPAQGGCTGGLGSGKDSWLCCSAASCQLSALT